jgi:autotransporter-associated beta strand protein
LANGTTLSIGTHGDSLTVLPTQLDFISIDGTSDTDFFSFTLTRTLDVTLNLTPRGATYNQGPEGGTQVSQNTKTFSDLTLALFSADGTTLINQANNTAAGFAESLVLQLGPGTYYSRVTGANDDVQLYGLQVSGTRVAADLAWTGQQSNVWDIASAENFADSVGPVGFYDQDRVTFDDTAAVSAVSIAENVQPESITVDTTGAYSFAGPGGIVGGNLTMTGGGSLELANDGNSYDGATEVQQGSLIVVTSTGTGDTTVHDGASLGGSGSVGGNLIAQGGATILPGTSLLPSSSSIEQDATLTVDGDFTHSLEAVLELQLRSVADFDALIITGSTSLAGTLSVQLGEVFTAAAGDRFDILSSLDGITGTFAELVLPDLGDFLAFDTIYEANTVALTVIPQFVVVPGDFDGDGDGDGRDFLAWQRGESPNPLSADDLAEWQANYAPGEAALAAVSVSVPEPTALVSFVIGIVGLFSLRRS